MLGVENQAIAPERRRSFWDKMAANYPSPFAPGSLADTERVIRLVRGRGVKLDNAKILDIGCGTGIYTLPLAQRASWVVGLDASGEMLDRLLAEKKEHGLKNVSLLHASWENLGLGTFNLEGAFDIVWTSMTPAVRGMEGLDKMHRCSKGWCVYIGWAGVRENEFLEKVFGAHDLSFTAPPGAPAIRALLKKRGIEVEMDTLDTAWPWEGSVAEAREYAAGFIAQQGVAPQGDIIADIVGRFSMRGRVRHTTKVRMGVLVWREA